MKYKTETAILAFILIFYFGYWSYQYHENNRIIDNFHLMIFMVLIFGVSRRKINK
jgi:hypothetical protein